MRMTRSSIGPKMFESPESIPVKDAEGNVLFTTDHLLGVMFRILLPQMYISGILLPFLTRVQDYYENAQAEGNDEAGSDYTLWEAMVFRWGLILSQQSNCHVVTWP